MTFLFDRFLFMKKITIISSSIFTVVLILAFIAIQQRLTRNHMNMNKIKIILILVIRNKSIRISCLIKYFEGRKPIVRFGLVNRQVNG